jgi:hypothetical protein
LLDGIVDRGTPIAANRALAYTRRYFNWLVERSVIETSPCDRVKAPAGQKQVFVYLVLKRYAELLTEGLYSEDAPAECAFAINASYSDKFGQQQTLTAVAWKFSRERAKQIVWEKFDPRNFAEVAIDYKITSDAANWISDEPNMAGGQSGTSAQCPMPFLRANAIFIRATTYCAKNYMDSRAGYYALAAARQCISLGEARMMASAKEAMQELDRLAKQRGKVAACRWVDEVEREVLRAALNR